MKVNRLVLGAVLAAAVQATPLSPEVLVQDVGSVASLNRNNNNKRTSTTADAGEPECVCQVVGTAMTLGVSGGAQQHFECLAVAGQELGGFSQLSLEMSMSSEFFKQNEPAFLAGDWFVSFDCDLPVNGAISATDMMDNQVHTLDTLQVHALYQAQDETRHRRLVRDSHDKPLQAIHHHGRRLSNVGQQDCAMVIVDTPLLTNPLTIAEADETLYMTTSGQFSDCSNGEMELTQKDATIRVTLDDSGAIPVAVLSELLFSLVCDHHGLPLDCDITKERGLDHILFSLPDGLADVLDGVDGTDANWAFASTGDDRRFSVYVGNDAFIPSVIMREYVQTYARSSWQYAFCSCTYAHILCSLACNSNRLGHNYRLGPANDPNDSEELFGTCQAWSSKWIA